MVKLYIQDDVLTVTKALPSAGSGTSATDAIQIKGGLDSQGGFYTECELMVAVPALAATILPAAVTGDSAAAAGKLTVEVQESDIDSATAWGTADTLFTFSVEGGATGGAAAVEKRYRLPISTKKYIRVLNTLNSTATDASAVSITAALVF